MRAQTPTSALAARLLGMRACGPLGAHPVRVLGAAAPAFAAAIAGARGFTSTGLSLCGCGNPHPHSHSVLVPGSESASPSAHQALASPQPAHATLIASRSNPRLGPGLPLARVPGGGPSASVPAGLARLHSSPPVRDASHGHGHGHGHSHGADAASAADADRRASYVRRTLSPMELLENNKKWAQVTKEEMPGFLDELDHQQEPAYLWIGCSDSRVPANSLVGLLPGEVFVHRNIANVVNHTDLSALSVLQYAVEALRVKHIMVVGHYGCGGVLAAMGNRQFGILDNWLRSIKDLYYIHQHQLEPIQDPVARGDLLCELNVARSVENVCYTSIVQNAWARGWELHVHGWCYRVSDGLLRDLHLTTSSTDRIRDVYKVAAE